MVEQNALLLLHDDVRVEGDVGMEGWATERRVVDHGTIDHTTRVTRCRVAPDLKRRRELVRGATACNADRVGGRVDPDVDAHSCRRKKRQCLSAFSYVPGMFRACLGETIVFSITA